VTAKLISKIDLAFRRAALSGIHRHIGSILARAFELAVEPAQAASGVRNARACRPTQSRQLWLASNSCGKVQIGAASDHLRRRIGIALSNEHRDFLRSSGYHSAAIAVKLAVISMRLRDVLTRSHV
jgi:hypothetical protein